MTAFPAGCDLVPSAEVQRLVPGLVRHQLDDGPEPVHRGCTWDDFGDRGGAPVTNLTRNAVPVAMRGGAEACVDLALSTQGATIHARYRNVLVRVDYVRAGTTSARDEAPTVAVTASVIAALSARWSGGR